MDLDFLLHEHFAGRVVRKDLTKLVKEGANVSDIPTIPGELFAKFQTGFYSDPRDATFKALGVE
jgi:predicted ATP-dependent Lon-type protease